MVFLASGIEPRATPRAASTGLTVASMHAGHGVMPITELVALLGARPGDQQAELVAEGSCGNGVIAFGIGPAVGMI